MTNLEEKLLSFYSANNSAMKIFCMERKACDGCPFRSTKEDACFRVAFGDIVMNIEYAEESRIEAESETPLCVEDKE